MNLARSLIVELAIPARFICSDIYELPDVPTGHFDAVNTSYGVLVWLPDLPRWAAVIAHFLKPSGTFYIDDGHPFSHLVDATEEAPQPELADPYFDSEPERCEGGDVCLAELGDARLGGPLAGGLCGQPGHNPGGPPAHAACAGHCPPALRCPHCG
ncbi:MAG: hypothetical protein CL878_14415 [Dehalococcoidia bacterium]|nr:hypothetical protein [Dehalococcoidia bacterium]